MNFTSELKHQDFVAAKDGAESARIDLNLSSWPVEINTLQDSENLITASLDYTGTLDWQTSQTGGVAKVTLRHHKDFSLAQMFNQDARWQFAISPDLPIALILNGGSGSVSANLSELQLASFKYDGGSGSSKLVLPANSGETLTSHIDGGSGSLRISLPNGGDHHITLDGSSGSYKLTVDTPATLKLVVDAGSGSGNIKLSENTSADITLDGGSGSTKIVVAGNPGIRIIIGHRGSGGVHLPSGLIRTAGGDKAKTGAWESANFDSAERQIIIRADLGSGSLNFTA